MNRSYLLSALMCAAALVPAIATAPHAGPTAAAQPTKPDTEIVVTGSRTKRGGGDTVEPEIVIDRQLIQDRGASNLADVLNTNPAFSAPGGSNTGSGSGADIGQSFVDLFGLGSRRTLTLVNGKRLPGGNSPSIDGAASSGLQVDFEHHPGGPIDRVETIAVAGAPIYGSNAIAGTVNVILKKRYTGVETIGRVRREAGGLECKAAMRQ